MLTLILGGARSGKSGYAQRLATASGLPVGYVATAEAGDAEMAERIARHQAERPAHWLTREAPLRPDLAFDAADCIVLDCLTLWLSNWLCRDDGAGFAEARAALLTQARAVAGDPARRLILVANEVGLGVIPMGELSRRFVDEAGWLNQELAVIADEVVFMAAGLPLFMKGKSSND
ncbi:MAG: bifunctional adenosylcobinamide kinase/adenosylcobinamide-phosphate guanylyltransferase [Gallionellaceae bacterium]|nr:bifunctional adenosylcobinamide kinase/adenosylcobinamide-phosphate guanylyltransferase [Gallionellaceae bacterium]